MPFYKLYQISECLISIPQRKIKIMGVSLRGDCILAIFEK